MSLSLLIFKLFAGQLRDGVSDLQIVVNLKAPITFFGMTIYSGLDLKKRLDLGNLETSVESLVLLLDRIASSISPASFSTTGMLSFAFSFIYFNHFFIHLQETCLPTCILSPM